jgi:hypothetical protein
MNTVIVLFISAIVLTIVVPAIRSYRKYRQNQVLDSILQAVRGKRLAVDSAEFRRSELPSRGAYRGTLGAVFDGRRLSVESYYESERAVLPLSLEVRLDSRRLAWDYRPPCRDYDISQIHFLMELDTYVRRQGFSKIVAYNSRHC